MKQPLKKSVAFTLILALCFTLMAVFATTEVQAASSKIHLKTKSAIVQVDGTYQLKLINTSGKTISASRITWTSVNKSIATVSKKGVVTGKKIGNAKITAKYKGKKYTFTAKVKPPFFMSGSICKFMTLGNDPCDVQFYGYKNGKIVNLSNSSQIDWILSDPTVVQIENGYATAKTAGYTDIAVKYKGKRYTRSKGLTVVAPYFKNKEIALEPGDTTKQILYCERENGEEYAYGNTMAFLWEGANVRWYSSNPAVASVNTEGTVIAKKEGTVVISVEVYGFTYSYGVKVGGGILQPPTYSDAGIPNLGYMTGALTTVFEGTPANDDETMAYVYNFYGTDIEAMAICATYRDFLIEDYGWRILEAGNTDDGGMVYGFSDGRYILAMQLEPKGGQQYQIIIMIARV